MLYKGQDVWGVSTAVDLYNCDPSLIRDADYIKKFVVELCELIDMKRYGDCHVIHFGEGDKEGYSMFQLIETSNISAHFANESNAVYLDVFSCKEYTPETVYAFAFESFKALEGRKSVILRTKD